MAKIYQPQESEKWIPHNLYMAIIYHIRDYNRQKEELENCRSSVGRGHNPTEKKGLKVIKMGQMVSAIDCAMECIPPEYRAGLWEHIVSGAPYPDYAAHATWRRHKLALVRLVGENLGYLDPNER